MRYRLFIACYCMILGMALVAAAQPCRPWDGVAQFRDALFDPSAHTLYAAAYDQNQILVIEAPSGKTLASLPAGQGPIALALSPDGSVLACANRLDNSVSLFRVPGASLLATVPTGEGPSSIATIPGGLFAVVNTFSNNITLISHKGETLETIPSTVPVPVDIAAAGESVAVIGRAEPAVWVYPRGLRGAPINVPTRGLPVSVTAMNNSSFAIAAADGISIVSADGKIIAQNTGTCRDAAGSDGVLWALSDNLLHKLSSDLAPIQSIQVPEGVRRLTAVPDSCALLAPAMKTGYFIPPSATPTVAQTAPVIVEDAADVPPTAAQTAPVIVEDAADVPPTAAQTAPVIVEATATAPSEPAQAPREIEAEPSAPATPEPASDKAALSPAPAPTGSVKRYAAPASIRAPRPGKPSASPMAELSKRTLSDAMLQPTEFGAPGSGFVAPDWTQPFRDIQAGKMRQNLDTGRTELEDNVRLRLGDMYFQADKFAYTDDAGEMHATGNVKVEQQDSRILAQEIQYQTPPEKELPAPSIFEIPLDEQGRAKQRLTLGHVYAREIAVSEPTRALKAEVIDYDFANEKGELINAKGQAGIYYFSAKKLRILGPNSMEGEDVWITTCDHDPPHYRLRLKNVEIKDGVVIGGTNIRLQLGKASTPLFLPMYRRGGGDHPWNIDFDSGREADIGYFINVGTRFEVNPYVGLGPRIMPTEEEGVGIGADLDYDYMENPASRLYRTKGEVHGLYTTEERGYLHLSHRYAPSEDLILKAQVEHWGDQDFYKDFFYDQYRNRTTPRSFANITYRQPEYIATGTVRTSTHGWVHETERLPEATFHLLERPLTKNLFLTFDTIDGYNRREPSGEDALRSVNIARLTYDWDPLPALNVTPFLESQLDWYSDQREDGGATGRFTATSGVTLQTRLHREYAGRWGFSAFKHLVLPSITYSYRPGSAMDVEETPHFDALDTVWGRSRIETKIDNVVYGRDAETGEVWQVGRLTLYQGNDFWNETRKSDDYEIEIDVRPRPWWGLQLAGERHVVSDDLNLDSPYFAQQAFYQWYDRAFGKPFNDNWIYDFNAAYGDYSRILTQLYYDDTATGGRLNGRLGYAYTETQNRVFNKGVLYGLGYKLGEKWGVGFEHIYDFEDDRLRQQTYELRRNLHCWEAAIRWRERESGSDINLEFSISAFPGSRIKL